MELIQGVYWFGGEMTEGRGGRFLKSQTGGKPRSDRYVTVLEVKTLKNLEKK